MYSFILKNIFLPIADKLMHTKVFFFYKLIKRMQKFSLDEIQSWQNKRLQDLIIHAYQNTEYYKKLFNKLKISPSDIKKISDLEKIPILTKDIIKKNYKQLIPSNINSIRFKESSTGGSSGDPLRFNLDLDCWSYITANTIVYWEKYGYNYGDKFMAIGSSSLFIDDKKDLKHSLYYMLKKKVGVNGIDMSDEKIKSYIEIIRSKEIKFIYGYASAIYLISKYALENQIRLNIISVFPTSEILTDLYRDTIQKAFNCNIVDGYGAHDGGISAFQTPYDNFELGYNTLLRTKNLENNIGDVLLTNLYSKSMPFINYSVGDKVQIDSKNISSTKFNGQTIRKVFGRTSDIIYLENGKVLTGPGFTILFKDLNVNAYKIKKIDKMHLECTIIKADGFLHNEESIIINTFKKQAGKDCQISLKYLSKFPELKSGKKHYFYAN